MQKAYQDLDIQFLPDNIIDLFNQQVEMAINTTNINYQLGTQLVTNENLSHIHFIREYCDCLNNFITTHINIYN